MLSFEDRLDAAFTIARQVFKKAELTIKDIDKAVKSISGKAYEQKNWIVFDTGVLIAAFVFGGIPKKAVEKAFAESRMYVIQTLLNEYPNVPLALNTNYHLFNFLTNNLPYIRISFYFLDIHIPFFYTHPIKIKFHQLSSSPL